MKKKTPSNPLPLAESLNLSLNAGTAQEQASQNSAEPLSYPENSNSYAFRQLLDDNSLATHRAAFDI
jgi:hypothetical protein